MRIIFLNKEKTRFKNVFVTLANGKKQNPKKSFRFNS